MNERRRNTDGKILPIGSVADLARYIVILVLGGTLGGSGIGLISEKSQNILELKVQALEIKHETYKELMNTKLDNLKVMIQNLDKKVDTVKDLIDR